LQFGVGGGETMEPSVVWLFIFVALYWAYCIFWGIKGALSAKTASDYFIAGRGISIFVFVLAATATSFSGWTFIGHPGLEYRDGFPYAYASFYAITIPLTGVLFLKRQWILGKHFGFVTPGEMLSEYFKGDAIRLLTVVVALCFSIPYLGLQLRASGFLFNVLTDGLLGVEVGMWLLSAVVLIYVASGGLRAVAYVDTLQCILLAVGIIVIGFIALSYIGGWGRFIEGIAALSEMDTNRTPQGYSHYVAIPGIIQFVSNGPSATGGAWTGVMIMTYMFALMGIQASPAFSMWAFANRSPAAFAPQQVWASAFGIGLILFFFTVFQGIGSHFLGADAAFAEHYPDLTNNVLGPALDGQDLMQAQGKQGMLVPLLIGLMSNTAPWIVGLLAVCALAAMQSTGAAYMSTTGAMLTRDLLKHFLVPDASHAVQKLSGRIGVAIIIAAALVVASTADDALVLLGGLAVAFGFQMFPALMAICYFPWLTRAGVTWGLLLGIIGVICTESFGQSLGITAWGRWPLTLHSAFWGIALNLSAAIVISAFTQDREEREHRMGFHRFLAANATVPAEKRYLIPVAWGFVLVWFFFAIGPGAVIGNTLFGDPNAPATWWVFGMPSIWVWQIMWWVAGVAMMWLLAYKLEMSTSPRTEITALIDDIGDLGEGEDRLEHVPAK
jgi:SSS family solute:Na+ symporter